MKKMRVRILLVMVALVISCSGSVASSGEEPSVARLASNNCYFFAFAFYTGTEFLALLNSGRYLEIDREHMGTEVEDVGKWMQDEKGELRLTSEQKFRSVQFGPLSLAFYGDDKPDAVVPPIIMKLRTLLEKSRSRKDFKADEVRSVGDIGIAFESEDQPVPRGDVEGMVAALEAFQKASDQNVFRYVPLSHKGKTFLWGDNDPSGLIKQLQEVGQDEFPPFIYVSISRETFRAEAGRTQPFMYHPEMNQKVADPDAVKRADVTNSCPSQ